MTPQQARPPPRFVAWRRLPGKRWFPVAEGWTWMATFREAWTKVMSEQCSPAGGETVILRAGQKP